MKRVDLSHISDLENLAYHLARYKFVARTLSSQDSVIEVGCGYGYGAYFLSGYCKKVIGIDVDNEVIKAARHKFKAQNLEYKYLDIVSSEVSLPKTDIVVCFEVIEHMERNKALILMKRIKDILGNNGVAFISTPRRIEDVYRTENRRRSHKHEYTYEELKNDLSNVFSRHIILGQLDEVIGSLNPQNVWTYFCICW